MTEPDTEAIHSALRRLTDVDRLLHEPARLLIAGILYTVAQVDFIYLLHETGLTKGNLSAHLSKLEQAGYIQIEKTYRGKIPQTRIAMTDAGHVAFDRYRQQLAQVVQQLGKGK
jgi:DNA-binding MarR family transcriptional regulator